jgi:hypothetical protein
VFGGRGIEVKDVGSKMGDNSAMVRRVINSNLRQLLFVCAENVSVVDRSVVAGFGEHREQMVNG